MTNHNDDLKFVLDRAVSDLPSGMHDAPSPLNPDTLWSAGKQRRRRRHVTIGVLSAGAGAAAMALVFGAGLLGTQAGPQFTPGGAGTGAAHTTAQATTETGTPEVTTTEPTTEVVEPGSTGLPEEPSATQLPTELTRPLSPTDSATGGTWLATEAPPASSTAFVENIRMARHDGFDRVVIDLTAGDDTVGWHVGYVGQPILDGSGETVGMQGDSYLEVVLSGMDYPDPGSSYYSDGVGVFDSDSMSAVDQVVRGTVFEGRLQVFLGISGEPRDFQVSYLDAPSRLVIDVANR